MKMLPMSACLAFGLLVASPLPADVHFKYSVEGSGETVQDIMIRQGVLRMDQHDDHWTLFDTDKREMIVVDDSKKEYMVIDEELMEQLGDLDKLMDRLLDDALSEMPESQRAQMRGMMKGMMGGVMQQIQASIPEQSVEQTGETREIAGHSCEVMKMFLDGKLTMESCGADPEAMNIPSDDLNSIRMMQEYITGVVEQVDALLGTNMAASTDLALGKIPVETRHYDDGEEKSVSTLQSVSTDALDADFFVVPGDYTRQETQLPSL